MKILLIHFLSTLALIQKLPAQSELENLLNQSAYFVQCYHFDSAYSITERILEVLEKESPAIDSSLMALVYYWHGRALSGLLKKDDASSFLHKSHSMLTGSSYPGFILSPEEIYLSLASNWQFFNLDSSRFYLQKLNSPAGLGKSNRYDPVRLIILESNIFRRNGQLDSLQHHVQHGLELVARESSPDYEQAGQLKRLLAYWHEEKGDFLNAKKLYQAASLDFQKKFHKNHLFESVILADLANIALYQEKSQEAEDHLLRSLVIKLKFHGKFHPGTAFTYQLLGIACNQLKKYQEALKYNHLAIEINDSLYGAGNRWSANVYNNLGQDYLALKDLEKAEECFRRSYKVNYEVSGPGSFNLVYPLNNLGDLAMIRNQEENALQYYREAEEVSIKNYGDRYRLTLEVQIKLADLYRSRGEISAAESLIQNVLTASGFTSQIPFHFDAVSYPFLLLQALNTSASIQMKIYERERDHHYLEKALSEIIFAVAVFDSTRLRFTEDYSSQLFSENCYKIFELGIEISFNLYELTNDFRYRNQAWLWCEKSKGLLLLEAMVESKARHFSGIPEGKISTIRLLQQKLNQLSDQINFLTEDKKTELTDLQEEFYSIKSGYKKLIHDLEQKYPRYYQLKYDIPQLTIENAVELSSKLDISLLAYFWTENNSYCWLVQDDTIIWLKSDLPKYKYLFEEINQFTKKYTGEIAAWISFAESSHLLFQKIFGPLLPHLKEKLVIIPDGALFFLPVDCLVTQTTHKTGEFSYLTSDYAVTYVHSVSTLDQLLKKPGIRSRRAVYFAPAFSRNKKTGMQQNEPPDTLFFNITEVKKIKKLWPGKFLIGNKATEEAFEKRAGDYSILHLATHAEAGITGTKPVLYLLPSHSPQEDGLIHLHDLYGMELQNELVVLSACETGQGILRRGEGIFSLSRGFFYGGSKSLVASLWKVNDASTSRLMENFYDFLRHGFSKAEALQLAKKKLLQNPLEPWHIHPYYWAGWNLWGDPSALAGNSTEPKITVWIIAGILLLMITAYKFRKQIFRNYFLIP